MFIRMSAAIFIETYQKNRYIENGILNAFVQDNMSFSYRGILRGLHFQFPSMQAKLVQVFQGEVIDVIVDIRNGSPTFGKAGSFILSQENKKQLFIPKGFAHGYLVTSKSAVFTYKCSEFYEPTCEKGILWSDPDLQIPWPIDEPIISEQDAGYPLLKNIPSQELPIFNQ